MREKKDTGRKNNNNLNSVTLAKRHLLKAQNEISDAMDFSFGMLANAGEMLSLLGRIDRELTQIDIQLNRLGEAENGIS